MSRKCSVLIIALLSAAISHAPYSFAKDASEHLPPVAIPAAEDELKLLADQKTQQAEQAPDWIKAIQTRRLREYFPVEAAALSELPRHDLERLAQDAATLSDYYEKRDLENGEFRVQAREHVQNFVLGLTPKKLNSALRDGKVTQPIAEWSVEELVVREQIAALTPDPNFLAKTLDLVSGPHLFGATKAACTIVVAAAVSYGAYRLGGSFLAGAAVGALTGAVQAGPLAALLNAGTSWFLTPTTEFIRVLNARYTGRWEQAINRFFDRFRPKIAESPRDSDRNTQPRVATLKQDGMNFAYMTESDQNANWDKNLRMWVAVAKRFGQLLRDTHHTGRVLMMISWSDEQNSTQLVETMDVKLVSLGLQAETLLSPYKIALMVRGENEKKDELVALFDRYEALCDLAWMSLDPNEETVRTLNADLEGVQKQLMAMGVSERDMIRLNQIQAEKAKAVGTIVTALTVNEIRSFAVAEANRNLEDEARAAQRVVRKGYQLQSYVEKYLPLVQELQRRMGYQNSGQKPSKERACEVLLGVPSLSALPPGMK